MGEINAKKINGNSNRGAPKQAVTGIFFLNK